MLVNHVLRQVPNLTMFRHRDFSLCRRLMSGEHFQQGTFSRSVFPGKTNPVFGIDQKRYVIEQIIAAEADRYGIN
jgi:hypothetical protein